MLLIGFELNLFSLSFSQEHMELREWAQQAQLQVHGSLGAHSGLTRMATCGCMAEQIA
jgi:hypothetical protein